MAEVSVTNSSTTETMQVGVEESPGRSFFGILQTQVYDQNQTLVFANCPSVMLSSSGSDDFGLKFMPGESKRERILIFARGVEMGLPRPGNYRLRVGLPMNPDFVSWSEFFPFQIGEIDRE